MGRHHLAWRLATWLNGGYRGTGSAEDMPPPPEGWGPVLDDEPEAPPSEEATPQERRLADDLAR